MSPFKALYGQESPLLVKGADIPSKLEKVNQLSKDKDELLQELNVYGIRILQKGLSGA